MADGNKADVLLQDATNLPDVRRIQKQMQELGRDYKSAVAADNRHPLSGPERDHQHNAHKSAYESGMKGLEKKLAVDLGNASQGKDFTAEDARGAIASMEHTLKGKGVPVHEVTIDTISKPFNDAQQGKVKGKVLAAKI